MWAVCKKELRQFFSSLTGYIAIIVFLLLNGLLLFVFPDTDILSFGYATLDKYFELAPWILLLLIPAITMRSFSDEFRMGTIEILQTRPLSKWQLVLGKYISALLVVLIALLPTLVYFLSIQRLSAQGGIEIGFDAATANLIAAQTVKGAAELLLKKGSHPEQEIDKVTTPKGCTIAGLNEMEHQGFSSSLIKGLVASYDKIAKD